MEVNGIAHLMLTVGDFEACVPFYERLLGFPGLRPVLKMDGMLCCVGARTAVGIVKAEDRHQGERLEPSASGGRGKGLDEPQIEGHFP